MTFSMGMICGRRLQKSLATNNECEDKQWEKNIDIWTKIKGKKKKAELCFILKEGNKNPHCKNM